MYQSDDFNFGLKAEEDLLCDNKCCYDKSGNVLFCFKDHNYFDRVNVTETPTWDLALRWSYTIPVLLFGVIGNATVIILLLKNRLLLRTTVNHFILNMSIADLILSLIGPVQFTMRETNHFWPFDKLWCTLDGFLQSKYFPSILLISERLIQFQ